MIFRCVSCDSFKLKTKKTYTMIVYGEGWEREMYMCAECGKAINSVCDTALANTPKYNDSEETDL